MTWPSGGVVRKSSIRKLPIERDVSFDQRLWTHCDRALVPEQKLVSCLVYPIILPFFLFFLRFVWLLFLSVFFFLFLFFFFFCFNRERKRKVWVYVGPNRIRMLKGRRSEETEYKVSWLHPCLPPWRPCSWVIKKGYFLYACGRITCPGQQV